MVRIIALLVAALVVSTGCGVHVSRPDMGYYFTEPVLNEAWKPLLIEQARSAKKVAHKAKKKKKNAAAATTKKAQAKGKGGTGNGAAGQAVVAADLRQPLRGNEAEVVRGEVVLSAQRLVGIRDSFTQDSFLRHVITVNNLGLGDVPEEGVVRWLHARSGKGAKEKKEIRAGDFVFLGDGEPEIAVVAEAVDGGGVVSFVGLINGEVKRGVFCPASPNVRRDERTQKVLNSFVDRTHLAGELVVGAIGVQEYAAELADRNP